jgi:hypothetical protein
VTRVDHTYVEEHGLLEAYLADRLSDSERDAFEAHYFACATCIEQLEAAEDFRDGMRQVAAEETARGSAVIARVGLLAAVARLSLARRLALAGAFLLLVLFPLGFLIARNRGLERELAEARTVRPAPAPAARIAEALPQANVPLFTLATVRGGEAPGREPVNQIPLSSTAGSVILDLELATVDFPSYRASLRSADGKTLWQGDGLRPDSRDSLVLLLPAAMLPPGVYRLTLEGIQDGGRPVAVADYPFRVLKSP